MLTLERLYEGWAPETRRDPPLSLDEMRAMFEHGGDVTSEPGGLDFIEADVDGIPGLWARTAEDARVVLLCFNGGGFVVGSRFSHRKLFGHFAKAAQGHALIIDYALAPERPHPGPLDDAVKAYRWLLDRGTAAADIVLIGDSAGGSLAVAAALRLRDLGLPAPRGVVSMSPYFDLEARGASFERNAASDILVSRDIAQGMAGTFLGEGGDPRDPTANPLYSDLAGLPPVLIQASRDETLFDGAVEFRDKAEAAGVSVGFQTFDDQQHVFQFAAGHSDTADTAIRDMAAWIGQQAGRA